MKYGLSKEIYENIKKITNKYNYEFKLFGSRARGDFKFNSDIDIVIIGDLMDKDKYNILNDFDLIDMPYKLDIVFWQDITKQELKENIEKEGVIF